MRVAVMGAGGVGGYYGGMLARAGEDVAFIARGANLDAIRSNGLTVKTSHVGEFSIPVNVTENPGKIGPVDLVLFCVKTYDTEVAARLIRPLIDSETVVMSLQNGIENEERIGRIIGHKHMIGAATYISSRIEAPGLINESTAIKMYLGELDGKLSARTERLLKTFERAGVSAEIPTDIRTTMWGKLIGISAFASVACVTRLPAGAILACPETALLLWRVTEEGYVVARTSGVSLPDDFVDQLRNITATTSPSVRPSMYYDLEAGRRIELEALVGTVVRLGEKHGVPTPLTFAMYATLKPYANGAPQIKKG